MRGHNWEPCSTCKGNYTCSCGPNYTEEPAKRRYHSGIKRVGQPTYFQDIDDCLIYWNLDTPGITKTVDVIDPLDGKTWRVGVCEPMVQMVKSKFNRGCFVVVWSKSDEDWAHAVIQALGLNNYVHQTMGKPESYGDDNSVDTWMTNRIDLKPDHKWRNNEVPIDMPATVAIGPGASPNENPELRTETSTPIVQSGRY